jgi:formate-dependent nitrite reductase membrane component NrfD
MDPKVNGQLQRDWGWLIAAYLFLGGVGAGAYAIAAINGFMGEGLEAATTIGLWIGFPALLIGTIFLMADLGSPSRAILAGMKPRSSWIARGTWIISAFMALSFLHLVLHRFTGVGETAGGITLINIISVLGIACAVGTMAYTGILLGASKGIPFWRTGSVPVVFVVSALVTGHFTIMIGMAQFNAGADVAPLRTMALEAAVLVVLEVLAILFFLQAAYRQPDSRESAERIMRKKLFVVGYFIVGLALPLALMVYTYRALAQGEPGGAIAVVAAGAVLGLFGGLVLRWSVLVCGALPTLNIAGFEFRRIARPKEPKPGIGMLPPQ